MKNIFIVSMILTMTLMVWGQQVALPKHQIISEMIQKSKGWGPFSEREKNENTQAAIKSLQLKCGTLRGTIGDIQPLNDVTIWKSHGESYSVIQAVCFQ